MAEDTHNPGLSEEQVDEAWPWMRGLRRIVRTVSDPRLFGITVLSGCDVSGLHYESNYRVYGFIFADAFASPHWPELMRDVRRRFLPNNRRMSFKALNDGHRREALVPFLQATELMTGVCVLVAVNKAYRYMATTPATLETLRRLGLISGEWNIGATEAALRIVLIWSLIAREVCTADQHLTLALDEDEVVANDLRHDDVLQLTGRFSSLLIGRRMGELCVCTTADTSANIAFEDFVAVADVAAGAFSELMNKISPPAHSDPANGPFYLNDSSKKSDIITDWFFTETPGLRRVAAVIDKHPDGRCSVRRISRGTEE